MSPIKIPLRETRGCFRYFVACSDGAFLSGRWEHALRVRFSMTAPPIAASRPAIQNCPESLRGHYPALRSQPEDCCQSEGSGTPSQTSRPVHRIQIDCAVARGRGRRLQRHDVSRLPDFNGDKLDREEFQECPLGYGLSFLPPKCFGTSYLDLERTFET